MKKFFYLLRRNLRGQVLENPFRFLLILFSLCVCTTSILFVAQLALQEVYLITPAGELVRQEKISKESAAGYLVIMALILAFAVVNIVLLFQNVMRQRRKTNLMYKMFGCPRGELFFSTFFELLLCALLGGALGTAVFRVACVWLASMSIVIFSQAYGGLLLYALVVLALILFSSIRAAALRLNNREG